MGQQTGAWLKARRSTLLLHRLKQHTAAGSALYRLRSGRSRRRDRGLGRSRGLPSFAGSGGCLYLRLNRGRTLSRPLNLNAPLQQRAIIDADALGDDLPLNAALGTNVQQLTAIRYCPSPSPSRPHPWAWISAVTWLPCPTVTRCLGTRIEPSMLPSMNNASLPLTSPYMTTERPMVACSVTTPAPAFGTLGGTGAGTFGGAGEFYVFHKSDMMFTSYLESLLPGQAR
jgi:hypothetical protein